MKSASKKTKGLDIQTLQMALVGYQCQLEQISAKMVEIRRELAKRRNENFNAVIVTGAKLASPAARAKRRLSVAARKRIGAAQKKRWAAFHEKRAAEGGGPAPKKKPGRKAKKK